MLEIRFDRLLQTLQPGRVFAGDRGGEMQPFATARMINGQFPCVEHQSPSVRALALRLGVDWVADEWSAFVFHVHADLMGATGVKVAQDESGAV